MTIEALAIHPRKLVVHIPTIAQIEFDCNNNIDKICARIVEFWADDERLKNSILRWVKYLYESGQKAADWDIDKLLVYSCKFGKVEEKYLAIEDVDERLRIQVLDKMGMQLRELSRYKKMYNTDNENF